ncbi:HEAT repeat domain-containing protein [Synechococcales cyanobacterium C]|uniref:HEAT repeat domain-containing protein n=1 Tax=Petrachloros mirabilis ULC683 TaxID=2781853 RepID=A0A8K1ZYB8_9CYAN|nr:HEAT repeat domain-containing protein [Petrachloros mirabilis]NCJ06092.1 HEAT repeat domain-containing protein [Petrachloros mirabilis ULC683]
MTDSSLQDWEAWLHGGSLDQCKAALDALAKYPAHEAVPILQRLLTHPDVVRRRFAVMGLGNHPTAASWQILTTLITQEQDDNILAEAANTLCDFGEAAVPLLVQLFERCPHWLTRQTILAILMDTQPNNILLSVVRMGLLDKTLTVRETAILALGSLLDGVCHGEAMVLLTELSGSSVWRDRWQAAIALRRSQTPEARKRLAALRQDDHPWVVAAALEATLQSS